MVNDVRNTEVDIADNSLFKNFDYEPSEAMVRRNPLEKSTSTNGSLTNGSPTRSILSRTPLIDESQPRSARDRSRFVRNTARDRAEQFFKRPSPRSTTPQTAFPQSVQENPLVMEARELAKEINSHKPRKTLKIDLSESSLSSTTLPPSTTPTTPTTPADTSTDTSTDAPAVTLPDISGSSLLSDPRPLSPSQMEPEELHKIFRKK